MATRRPSGIESLLMKPYFWQRPSQLLRRVRRRSMDSGRHVQAPLPWGLTIECDPQEMVGSAITRTGVFEIATTETLMRLADPGELVLDVGANIGYMTGVLAVGVGARGRVFAFEPNPTIYPQLVSNVTHWRMRGVAAIETSANAVSDSVGVAELELPTAEASNQSTASLSPTRSTGSGETAIVHTVTLDELFGTERLGLLKLDVEGHEPAVLRGARGLMGMRSIRDVVFEDHKPYPSDATRLLEEHGYAVFSLIQRPLRVELVAPEAGEPQPSWDAPMHLATLDPARALTRLRPRGWCCLRRRLTL